MILYKEELIKLAGQESVKLECAEEGKYIYVSRNTYDQALLISDRFEGEITIIKEILDSGDNHAGEVYYFYNNAPEPINILAPFINLIDSEIKLNENLEELCGVLHMMSMVIDFNNYLKVPLDIRSDILFGKDMVMNYKDSWDELQEKISVAEIEDAEVLTNLIKAAVGSVVEELLKQHVIQPSGYGDVNTNTDEDKSLEGINIEDENFDPWAMMDDILKQEVSKTEKEQEMGKADVKEDAEQIPSTGTDSYVVLEQEPSPVKEKEQSIYDKIAELYGGA